MKKPPVQTAPRATTDERMLTIRRGEKIEQILVNNRVAQSTAREVTTLIAQQMKDTPIKEGQKLRILLALPSNPKSDPQLLRVMLYDADQILAIAAINDRGSFVAVAPPSTEGTIGADEQPDGEAEDQSGFRLYDSLYETALKNEIPKPIIDQLIKIYFYDVDLQRKVAAETRLKSSTQKKKTIPVALKCFMPRSLSRASQSGIISIARRPIVALITSTKAANPIANS